MRHPTVSALAWRVRRCHLRGVILPPTLVPGDRVSLIAPAGPVSEDVIETALSRCAQLGLEPVQGAAIRSRDRYLAGRDEDRAEDMRQAIQGESRGIWALRGGYGTFRTLKTVDLGPLRDRPKAFIGFSDNTVVHMALRAMGLVSFHGPHAGYAHFPEVTEQSFRAAVMSSQPPGLLPLPVDCRPEAIRGGTAEGPLLGGNLSMLAAVCGTPYQPMTRGAILFIEDVGEAAYRVDRMLMQLRLAGLLDELAAVAVGDFSPAEPEPAVHDVLVELLRPLGVPVLSGLPFGHERQNWTLPVGVRARLDAESGTLEILEPATRPIPT